jgi:hypothetical protein
VAARYGNTECCKMLGDAESGGVSHAWVHGCGLLTWGLVGCLTAELLETKAMPWYSFVGSTILASSLTAPLWHRYHGKLNRVAAEHVLSLHGLRDGLFLVRESSSVANDFVLTMAFEGNAYHFQVCHDGWCNVIPCHSSSPFVMPRLHTKSEAAIPLTTALFLRVSPASLSSTPPQPMGCLALSSSTLSARHEGKSLVLQHDSAHRVWVGLLWILET